MYSHCHQIITQQWPKGPQALSEVTSKSGFFSAAGKRLMPYYWGPTRGADLGNLETAPGSPVVGLVVHIEEESGTEPRSGSRHSGSYRPTKFCPPLCKQPQNGDGGQRLCMPPQKMEEDRIDRSENIEFSAIGLTFAFLKGDLKNTQFFFIFLDDCCFVFPGGVNIVLLS